MLRKTIWLTVLLTVLFFAVIFALVDAGSIPKYVQVCERAANSNNENCERYHVASFVLRWIVKTFDDHNGIVTAVATIFIAAFTWILSRSTTRLMAEAGVASQIADRTAQAAQQSADEATRTINTMERNAHRDLRAYLWQRFKKHPIETPDGYIITGVLRNTGMTPAFDVMAWLDARALTDTEYASFDFAKADTEFVTPFVASPGSRHTLNAVFVTADKTPIMDGLRRLYIWGGITYRDAFGADHWRTYRLMFRVERGHGNWGYCKEGNNEDRQEPMS